MNPKNYARPIFHTNQPSKYSTNKHDNYDTEDHKNNQNGIS